MRFSIRSWKMRTSKVEENMLAKDSSFGETKILRASDGRGSGICFFVVGFSRKMVIFRDLCLKSRLFSLEVRAFHNFWCI